MSTEPYKQNFPEGVGLEELGLDGDFMHLSGLGLAGGVAVGEGGRPPAGFVLLVPEDRTGGKMKPMAIITDAENLTRLRDDIVEVFNKSIAAARRVAATGDLTGGGEVSAGEVPET
jgi:hypothetical protein